MSIVEVTKEERERYFGYSFGEIQSRFSAAPHRILWHYTTGTALIEIIKSGALWFTQISCLNDSAELRHAIQLLRRVFRERRDASAPTREEAVLYERIESGLLVDSAPTSEWFVFSLTEKPNDLSQWRAYGGSEGGYCRCRKSHPGWCWFVDRVISCPNVRGSHVLQCSARVDAWVTRLA
jgi:hypothetical protein